MKKKIMVSFLSFFLLFSVSAQGVMLVEDLTAIAAAIENGLTMYNNLMTTIEQYQRTCEQIKMKVKEMQDFDWSSIDPKSLDSFLGTVDNFMSLQDDLDSIINSKNMKIGDLTFSLSDVYSTDFVLNLMNETERKLDPRNISESEQKAFIARHGMTVDHYMKFINLEKEIATTSQKIVVTMEKTEEASKALAEVVSKTPVETGGEKEALDAMNMNQKAQTQEIIIQTQVLVDLARSVQNIGQLYLEKVKKQFYDEDLVQQAKENLTATYHNASQVSDQNGDYLHFWGSGTDFSGRREIEY